MQYFWFQVPNQPNKVKQIEIEASPLNEESDPDIYLAKLDASIDENSIGESVQALAQKFQWKANNHGSVRIMLRQNPESGGAELEKYLLSVEPMRKGTNLFQITLNVFDCPEKPLEISQAQEYNLQFQPSEDGSRAIFLKYKIENIASSTSPMGGNPVPAFFNPSLLLVEVSKKKGIQLFVSPSSENPGHRSQILSKTPEAANRKNNYRWAFGDFSADQVEKLLSESTYMQEICSEATPFFVEKKNGTKIIQYSEVFSDLELLKEGWENGPRKNERLMKEIFCLNQGQGEEQDDDTLTIVLDVHCWEHYGNKAFFGLFAKDDL